MKECYLCIGCYIQSYLYRVEDSIEAVISEKCVGKPLVKWLVDPLKFVVEEPAHKDLVYVAVVSRSNDGYFVLHEVYQQSRQKKATFDIAQPRRYCNIISVVVILYGILSVCSLCYNWGELKRATH